MRTLTVGRSVVREAITRLQATGLVETRHGIGTFVRGSPTAHPFSVAPETVVTVGDAIAMFELRISLETEAASLAASRCSDAQQKQLRAALCDFRSGAQNRDDTMAFDIRFHLLVAECSGNRYFRDLLGQIGSKMIPRATGDHPTGFPERVVDEHEDIYAAIARNDSETARAAMRTHLVNSLERLRAAHTRNEAATTWPRFR